MEPADARARAARADLDGEVTIPGRDRLQAAGGRPNQPPTTNHQPPTTNHQGPTTSRPGEGRAGQYLQLVRSAPGGAVFSIRSTPFGMNIWWYRSRDNAFGRVWSPFQQCSARSP